MVQIPKKFNAASIREAAETARSAATGAAKSAAEHARPALVTAKTATVDVANAAAQRGNPALAAAKTATVDAAKAAAERARPVVEVARAASAEAVAATAEAVRPLAQVTKDAAVGHGKSSWRGASLMLSAVRMWFTDPKLLVRGLLPAAIVGAGYAFAVVIGAGSLWVFSGWLIDRVFHDSTALTEALRILVLVALVLGALSILVRTFTTIVLWLGGPIYRGMSRSIDRRLGSAQGEVEVPAPAFAGVPRVVTELIKEGAEGVLWTVIGIVPAVGTAVSVIGSTVKSGRGLARELATPALARRGIEEAARDQLFVEYKSFVTGFGVVAYLLSVIPFAAVFVVPASVAGGTLLARRLVGEDTGDSLSPAQQARQPASG
jgi:CysZ protein